MLLVMTDIPRDNLFVSLSLFFLIPDFIETRTLNTALWEDIDRLLEMMMFM